MPAVPHPDLAPLVGSWRLLSLGVTYPDTGERVESYGPRPQGRMILDPGGRIMFLMTKQDRRSPTTDNERAELFNDMTAYTGLVRPDGPGRFITSVDLAWNPSWQGEQLRFFTLDRDRLTIRSPAQTHPSSGDRLFVGDLVWLREHPAA